MFKKSILTSLCLSLALLLSLSTLVTLANAQPLSTNTPHHTPSSTMVITPTGVFTDSGQRLGANYSFPVALGDVDNDGDIDAFVGNFATNKVWLNDGLGFFTSNGQGLGTSVTYDVALGDLDGDGDLDAFVANFGSTTLPNKVWFNNGGRQGGTLGLFSDSGQSLGSSNSYAVALGDIDGDTDLDAVVGNIGQPNKIWLNTGSGIFIDSGRNLGFSATQDLVLGDVDNDGDLDIFTVNALFNAYNEVWLNNGVGNFSDSGQRLGTADSWAVDLGDLDGDGDLDAFVANTDSNTVWINQGGFQGSTAGNFNDNGQRLGNAVSTSVDLGDLDGDGDLDAFVGNSEGTANKVWLNMGGYQGDVAGSFIDSGQMLGSFNTHGVQLADLNGSGNLDAFTTNATNQPNLVWFNTSGCTVAIPPTTQLITISSIPNDLLLAWRVATTNSDIYTVWHSTTEPYLIPATGTATILASGNMSSYMHSGALGDPSLNHYYIIRASNCDNSDFANSQRVGEFDFAIVPGS